MMRIPNGRRVAVGFYLLLFVQGVVARASNEACHQSGRRFLWLFIIGGRIRMDKQKSSENLDRGLVNQIGRKGSIDPRRGLRSLPIS
jgi:hypothetical protein